MDQRSSWFSLPPPLAAAGLDVSCFLPRLLRLLAPRESKLIILNFKLNQITDWIEWDGQTVLCRKLQKWQYYAMESRTGSYAEALHLASFDAPVGDEPVVVDLAGMGKGEAFVSGQSIGRYWANYTADPKMCHPCDHRGEYSNDRCRTGCRDPSQRWYHVPRSFLKTGKPNTLQVKFQTLNAGIVCANVEEGKILSLTCQGGRSITKINFARFGDVLGECGSFKQGKYAAAGVSPVVEEACVGQLECSVEATESNFGAGRGPRRLAVEAVCG
ncbi:hypothetical protein J5N97_006851 [Dioscorea zingiberensis]|uniref:SUEL-type lectin domain-containing protein n=1 Tax=Dioscorea zingiberensis TaxID=325984 RepID=A0A9D5DCU6_9LILI|nr:hypothetical protein J5N97_006851 [Dioscorea zingiberensis]